MRAATLGLLGLALMALAGGWLAIPRAEAFYLERAKSEGQSTLRLVTSAVNQTVLRFDPLPELIAERQSLRQALLEPENAGLIPFANEQLRQTALSVGASDVFLMDTTGTTIAASNYRSDRTFIGQNFAYRPYFKEARAGGSSRFHALGTTSGERGFYFAAPLLDGIDVRGVVAVKVTVDTLEDSWTGLGRDVLIADGNGIVFMASRANWRFRSLVPIAEGMREQIERTRQFPLDLVRPLNASTQLIAPHAVELSIPLADHSAPETFLAESAALDLHGWHAIVLTPLPPIRTQALVAFAVWSLLVLVVSLFAFIVLQRRAGILETMRIQKTERDLLEERVQARTRDLDQANADLKTEVEERRAAEAQLRRTQKELVQAGKLAALGQMSAALSHEINQPLAAVKSYAENALGFIDRDRVDEARENVTRISEMADRMARLSGVLRNFARRPSDRLVDVSLADTIDEAVALLEPQLRARGAHVDIGLIPAGLTVVGGQLRLQQVLVNLLSNALDAMQKLDAPRIEISAQPNGDHVDVLVRDHGDGLSMDAAELVFEPFFTTKDVGKGLGLGLSISFNIIEDFGGRLSAFNHEDGGAVFRIRLRRGAAGQMVAE